MTAKPVAPQPETAGILQFPDPPPEEMTAFEHVNFPAYPPSLALHFGSPETTIITSEVAAGLRATVTYEGVLFPDLLIAFNVDPEARRARNGYLISEQGKPPDFVLEVASETTARRDETHKREAYAAMGVPEYWRFDGTGGRWYQAHLAADRFVEGLYVAIPIHQTAEGHYWGHSDSLNLDLCWEAGNLRFWDPIARIYLNTFADERAARSAAEARAMEAEARAVEAEARARESQEELRRLQSP